MARLLPAISLLLVSMLSIQYGASLAKQLFPLVGAAGTTFLRVLFSAVILTFVSQLWKMRVARRQIFLIALYGFALGAMNLLFYLSLERIPLGIAVALEFCGPLGVSIFLSQRRSDYLWILFAAVGIYMLLPLHQSAQSIDPLGALLALAAGFFWGVYILIGKKVAGVASSLQVTSLGMWAAFLAVLPLGLYWDGDRVFNISYWPLGIVVALLSSSIPYVFEMKALKKVPAHTFGVLMSLEPVVATGMGFVFLKETLSLTQGIAIVFIMIASVGVSLFSEQKEIPSAL